MLTIAFGQEPSAVEREVSGPFGSFFVTVRPLTLGERARYWSATMANDFEEVIRARIEHVIAWRGVVDPSGADVPFNRSNLDNLLGANDGLFSLVLNEVHRVFSDNLTTITDAERKN